MDWSHEQKLCFADRYRHIIILWDTLYINYRNKLKIEMCSFCLCEMIMKDLHKSFHFEHQLAKKLSGLL
jgi:hypothetical protein